MELKSGALADDKRGRSNSRASARLWIVIGLAMFALAAAALTFSPHGSARAADAPPALPKVEVSKPLVENLDTRLSFLGQFSAVSQVDLRAQVGGTLTGIFFKDGDIVKAGALLFEIDPTQYEIKLASATAQVEKARTQAEKARTQVEKARAQVDRARAGLELASQQLTRAETLRKTDAGTVENLQQRSAEQISAKAAMDEAQAVAREAEAAVREAEAVGHEAEALVRDARYDLDHCKISAPFTGRIGTHLVSVGNLIAGSRTSTSPATLLATLVSLDPIHFDFDMSESDYLAFSKYREHAKGAQVGQVALAVGDESRYTRTGVFDFLDNVLDRSSGTIHGRATVQNSNFTLMPGEFARVQLVVAPVSPTLLVPDAAVVPDQSQHAVLTVSDDGTVAPKQVQVGDIREGLRVIRSGLAPTDKVIIEGLPYAAPGSKVAPQEGAIRLTSAQGEK